MRCCALRDMFDFQETVDLPHEPVNNFFLLFSRPLLACLGAAPRAAGSDGETEPRMNTGAAATTASDRAANAVMRVAPAVAMAGSTATEAAAAGCSTLPPLTMIIILAATLLGSAVSRTAIEALTESSSTVTASRDVVYVFWIVAMFVPFFLVDGLWRPFS